MRTSKAVPTKRRAVPLPVKLHAVLVILPLCLHTWSHVSGQGEPPELRAGETTFLAVVLVAYVVLFVLMLQGRSWARILLGVLTLPVGFLLLGPRSSVEFTEPSPDEINQPRRLQS